MSGSGGSSLPPNAHTLGTQNQYEFNYGETHFNSVDNKSQNPGHPKQYSMTSSSLNEYPSSSNNEREVDFDVVQKWVWTICSKNPVSILYVNTKKKETKLVHIFIIDFMSIYLFFALKNNFSFFLFYSFFICFSNWVKIDWFSVLLYFLVVLIHNWLGLFAFGAVHSLCLHSNREKGLKFCKSSNIRLYFKQNL